MRTHYTAKELAEMTGLRENLILSWGAKGVLPSARVGTKRLFPAEKVMRVLNGEAAPDNLVSIERRSA